MNQQGAQSATQEPIAVIELSGYFPGSSTLEELFRNILRKRCFIRDLPAALWEQNLFYSEDPATPSTSYSRLGALVADLPLDMTPFRIPPIGSIKAMAGHCCQPASYTCPGNPAWTARAGAVSCSRRNLWGKGIHRLCPHDPASRHCLQGLRVPGSRMGWTHDTAMCATWQPHT